METRVTYRTSQETVKRLQELSDKYGISQSALLTMLVNERWLLEKNPITLGGEPTRERGEAPSVNGDPAPPPNFPTYVPTGKKKKHRKRH
jgi:hypothetical protein